MKVIILVWAAMAVAMAGEAGRGTLAGRVLDPSNAVVSGAKVLVTNQATGDRIDGITGSVILRNGESCVFESDGFRNWYVVAFSRRPRRSRLAVLQHPEFGGVIS